MPTVRSNAHDIAQSQGSGWSAHAATELARKRKLIALIGLLLACLLFSAVVAPESAAARIPAPTENMSPWCGVLAATCLGLLGIGSMILAYEKYRDGFLGRGPFFVRFAFALIFIAFLILEVVSYAMLLFEAFRSHVQGASMGLLLLVVFVASVLVWRSQHCRGGSDIGNILSGVCDLLLLSLGIAAAVLLPVVALFWMVGRHGIALMFTWAARGGLRVADLLNFTGCIWALYSLALLYLFRCVLHGLVFWICTLVQASPTVQEAETAVVRAWNRWMSLYLLGWTMVVCAQLVATMLNVQQLFRSAPALMMTVMAPQIPLIAAYELMPFRFAKGVSQMQLIVLISSVVGLNAAVVRGYQGGGVVSPVTGGTVIGTLVSMSTFGLGVLLSILVDRVRQCFRNSELQRQQACLQTEPSLPLTP